MTRSELLANPFALMMEPDAVVRAMEESQPLARLRRQSCSPLAKLADDYTIHTGEDFGDLDGDDFGADLGLDFEVGHDDFY